MNFKFFFYFLHLFIFEKQSETKREQGRGRERRRHRIWSRLRALSKLTAQSLMRGSNPQTVISWPEPKSVAQPIEPPRRPRNIQICKQTFISWRLFQFSQKLGELIVLNEWWKGWSAGQWWPTPSVCFVLSNQPFFPSPISPTSSGEREWGQKYTVTYTHPPT